MSIGPSQPGQDRPLRGTSRSGSKSLSRGNRNLCPLAVAPSFLWNWESGRWCQLKTPFPPLAGARLPGAVLFTSSTSLIHRFHTGEGCWAQRDGSPQLSAANLCFLQGRHSSSSATGRSRSLSPGRSGTGINGAAGQED